MRIQGDNQHFHKVQEAKSQGVAHTAHPTHAAEAHAGAPKLSGGLSQLVAKHDAFVNPNSKPAFPRPVWQDGGALQKTIHDALSKLTQSAEKFLHPRLEHANQAQTKPFELPQASMRYGLPNSGIPVKPELPQASMRYGLPNSGFHPGLPSAVDVKPELPQASMRYGLPNSGFHPAPTTDFKPELPQASMRYGLPNSGFHPAPTTDFKPELPQASMRYGLPNSGIHF